MNEHSFRKSFEGGLKPSLNWSWKIHDSFAGGVPDSYYEGMKQDLWVEYKWVNLPKRDSTIIDLSNPDKYLSKLQQLWLVRRHELGRNDAIVIAGHSEGVTIFKNLEWKTPLTKQEFIAKGMSKKAAQQLLLSWIT